MIGVQSNKEAVLTRRVTFVNLASQVDAVEEDMKVELVVPDSSTSDGSPRDKDPYTLRWNAGVWGPEEPDISAGSRITIDEVEYELLENAKPLRLRYRAEAYAANAMPVVDLYPLSGTLEEQDGSDVSPIQWAAWSPNESHDTTGEYEDLEAEADITFADAVKRNRRINMNDTVYRILTATTETEGPRVTFQVRRFDG